MFWFGFGVDAGFAKRLYSAVFTNRPLVVAAFSAKQNTHISAYVAKNVLMGRKIKADMCEMGGIVAFFASACSTLLSGQGSPLHHRMNNRPGNPALTAALRSAYSIAHSKSNRLASVSGAATKHAVASPSANAVG